MQFRKGGIIWYSN